MNSILKLLAPYFAITIFWTVFQNAWLSIIAYHIQILFWNYKDLRIDRLVIERYSLLLLLSSSFTGLLVYFILPHIAKVNIEDWFTIYQIINECVLCCVSGGNQDRNQLTTSYKTCQKGTFLQYIHTFLQVLKHTLTSI